MSLQSLADAFVDELRDVYSAEKQLLKALPKMAKKATHPQLKQAFENHLSETEGQVERVEKVFESLELKPRAKTCEAMQACLKKGKASWRKMLSPRCWMRCSSRRRKRLNIMRWQRMERSAHGRKPWVTTKLWHYSKETMNQEVKADSLLSELADGSINAKAAEMANS